jgi:hypothetical protein
MKWFISLLNILLLLSLIVTGCAPAAMPTPEVVETVVVEKPVEYVLFENWSEVEIKVEIVVQTDSIEKQSTVSLLTEAGELIESITGDVGFDTIWEVPPGSGIVLECAEDVSCSYDIATLSVDTLVEEEAVSCPCKGCEIYRHLVSKAWNIVISVTDNCPGKDSTLYLPGKKEATIKEKSTLTVAVKVPKNASIAIDCNGTGAGKCIYKIKKVK